MGTNSSAINDLFTMLVNDYRLDALYQTSGSAAFTTYLEGWLLFSINDFQPYCTQDLTYDVVTQTFTEDLTITHQLMLARIMTKYWLQKLVQNVLQMNNNIQDHDFKTYSQAQNLKEKRELLAQKEEEISLMLEEYGYRNNNWDNWNLQIFGGG
jgi:hypothetical protein